MQMAERVSRWQLVAHIKQVDGIGIGSTVMDQAFVSLVNTRLRGFRKACQG
jgi:hypothetical protein